MSSALQRARSWSHFERRFRPIVRDDGSLLWDIDELTKPVDVRRLWTVLDCDGKLYVGAGFHYVNRLAYLCTEVPWTAADAARDWRYD